MLSKILKYSIFTIFIGMVTFVAMNVVKLLVFFPDWRIMSLTISVITFIVIIAIKRGVWH